MDRKGHYLKPGTKPTAPNVLFAVVQSPTLIESGRSGGGYWESWGGADVCCSKYRHGQWTTVRGARCETPDALYAWMGANCDRSARNYVVTPDGSSSLAVGRFWDHLTTAPVKWHLPGTIIGIRTKKRYPADTTWVRRCTLTPRVCIFDYARDDVRWVWLNGYQHFGMSEAELSKTIAHPWTDTGEYDPPDATVVHTSAARAVLWVRAYQHLASWWRATTRAPFGLTAASMAIGVLRTHIKDKTLCTHSNPAAHQLERDACHGGMQRVWYYGDIGNPRRYSTAAHPAPQKSSYGSIPGPVVQLDVRSMYPWLLREKRFPCKIAEVHYRMNPADLLAWCRCTGVIARVTIETETPEYPLRGKDHIFYPVGRFTTTLTGPELLQLAQEGRIAHVHYVCTYAMGRPFREAAGALIAMRDSARDETNTGWSAFAKQVANSLGGKLAQRRGEWVERADHPAEVPFGEWTEQSGRSGERTRFRSLANLVWGYQPDASGAGPYTAAFAYLTAYGRLHMRGIRDACPERSIVSMDTDGLWVVAGAEAAVPHVEQKASGAAGSLCFKCGFAAARFFGPKHYFTPDGWVLAGFASGVVKRGARTIEDICRRTPLAGRAGAPPRGTAVEFRTSTLAVESPGVSIAADGWATPRRRRGYS